VADRSALEKCRVLVIEDEYFIGDDLDKLLRQHGADVVGPIGTLHEALSQVAKDGFQVAVVDLNLRDEKAFPVADELRRRAVPFVFATGYSAEVIPERFRDVERWEKPYDERELLGSIGRICSHLKSSSSA
jgi:DNA-binding response OmpR family regulator